MAPDERQRHPQSKPMRSHDYDRPERPGSPDDLALEEEAEMQALLRGVSWTSSDELTGAGRLLLAGPKKLLVACRGEVPLMRSTVVVDLETRSGEPLGIHAEVIRSERGLVGGMEPGFIAQVQAFSNDGSAHQYRKLVRWLSNGRTAT